MDELIDPEEFFGTLTGFEEIAVRKAFCAAPTMMGSRAEKELDVPTFLRSLLFVEAKRAGANDLDAYSSVMDLTAADVMARFKETEPVGKAR